MSQDFKDIVAKHHGIFYKIARAYTIEKADFDDLYQEMLIQIWKSLHNFKEESKLSTWIYRVSLNTALTFQRKEKKKIPIKQLNEFENIDQLNKAAFEKTNIKEEKIELLYKCINQLKKDERAIILLYLENKKYEEIALIIGLKSSHIGVKINRIKAKLHKLLKANDYAGI